MRIRRPEDWYGKKEFLNDVLDLLLRAMFIVMCIAFVGFIISLTISLLLRRGC